VSDNIKTYVLESVDPRPMYALMSEDEYFFKEHCDGQAVMTTKNPAYAFTWGNDEHAEFELAEYENRFKNTKKKWRVVALYKNQKTTYNITERES